MNMKIEDMFESACRAWGVEMHPLVPGPGFDLYFNGKSMKMKWNRKDVDGYRHTGNEDVARELVIGDLKQVIHTILK